MKRERANGHFYLFRRAYSLKWKLWQYFVLFAFVILCLFYGLQMIFMQFFYQETKRTEIVNAAGVIQTSFAAQPFEQTTFLNLLTSISRDNMICIEIATADGQPLFSEHRLPACVLHDAQDNNMVEDLILQVLENKEHRYLGDVIGGKFNNHLMAYGAMMKDAVGHDAFVLINAETSPANSVLDTFRRQMMVMSVFVVILSAVLSMFPAQQVSHPLARITRGARELAKGNFNVRFDVGEYSELNELSETLNYAAKGLGQVDAVRKELIANVSHDLRTPLTMIKAYAEMVRDLSGNNPEKRDAHVGVIIEESDRLTRLVNDLLDLSRLENNAMPIGKQRLDLGAMVADILKRYSILSEREGYIFEQQGEASLEVLGNPQRMEQVLYNLINNAVQYSGDNKRVCVRLLRQEGTARVEVQDWGEGIGKDQLQHIWERYYKVDKTHKRPIVGTGLGLSIVRAALEQHGAMYGVDSELGKGSLFYFMLPLADEDRGVADELGVGDDRGV